MRTFNTFLIAAVAICLCGQVHQTSAALLTWTVQSAQSSITVTGTAKFGTTVLPLTTQAVNSNKAPLAGTFDTNLNLGSDIDVVASNLNLVVNGNWSPLSGGTLGTAPADLGMAAIFTKIAGRDMTLSLDTPALSLIGGPSLYTFAVSGTTTFTGGFLDYNITIPPAFGGPLTLASRSSDFVGSSGAITGVGGTLSIAGSLATLTIPYTASNVPVVVDDNNTADPADDITGVLNVTGVIVATAVVPEPSTLALLSLALVPLGGAAWRRRSNR